MRQRSNTTASAVATWSIKYTRRERQAGVGSRSAKAADGWTKRKAEAALRATARGTWRGTGYRKPEAVTFASFALEWLAEYPEATVAQDTRRRTGTEREIIEAHLVAYARARLQLDDGGRSSGSQRLVSGLRRGGLSAGVTM